MSPESIALGVVLLGMLAVAVAWPWLRPARRHQRQPVTTPQEEYQALVAAIRDLDFDYRAGVVTEEDYHRIRNDLAMRAATLLQELDRTPRQAESLETQVEAMVRALRAKRQRPSTTAVSRRSLYCAECGAPVQAGDRFCARCGVRLDVAPPAQAKPVCPECGASIKANDRFCTRCGEQLVEEVAIAS